MSAVYLQAFTYPFQKNNVYAESVLGILGPYAVSFLPLFALRCAYSDFGEMGRQGIGVIRLFLSGPIPYEIPQAPAWFEAVSWALAAVGLIYLPMALLVWSFFGGNTVLNPVFVIRNILRAATSYALAVVMVAGLLFAWRLVIVLAAELPLEGLQSLVGFFSLSYVLCVAMRIIGLHYFANRDRLQWERR